MVKEEKQFERPVLYMSRGTLDLFRKLIGAPQDRLTWDTPNLAMFGLPILFDDEIEYGVMQIEEAPDAPSGAST